MGNMGNMAKMGNMGSMEAEYTTFVEIEQGPQTGRDFEVRVRG